MIVSKTPLQLLDETALHYLKPLEQALLFDIETTGLNWRSSHLYMIGAVFCEGGQWTLQQWFLDRPAEETALLAAFSEVCRDRPLLVHYNGSAFDVPYLQHKYTFYQLQSPLERSENLDLYRLVRPLQRLLGLDSIKQRDVEQFLGISRLDPYSGGELIHIYRQFLQTREDALLQMLMLHNREDVQGLCRLLPMKGYQGTLEGNFSVRSVSLSEGTLLLTLALADPVPRSVKISGPLWTLQLEHSDGRLSVPGRSAVMKHFFPDYKNYYYLPEEDAAVHKSVGAYVDSAHRVRANASNCYQKVSGLFFPQPGQRWKPAFYEDYKSPDAFLLFSPSLLEDPDFLQSYACELLSGWK